MREVMLAGLVGIMMAMPATAQTSAEILTERLGDQVLSLRELGPNNQSIGPRLTMHIYASGGMRVQGGGSTTWSIWRIDYDDGDNLDLLCMTTAEESGGRLTPFGDELCSALAIEGNRVQLVFPQFNDVLVLHGTMRPM
jgi:hypothetical protein